MLSYILKRILLMVPTLLGAAILVFLLLRAVPGDVCVLKFAATGMTADQEQIDICREQLNLNRSMIVQFGYFVGGYFTFDLGLSLWTGNPVTEEIARRFELSLQVAIMATLFAAVIAMGMGADVTVLDKSLPRLAYIDALYNGRLKTLASTTHAIDREIAQADLVVGAVLVHGARAPKLVTNNQVAKMKLGSVLVDIAIDQGGCFEDSKPTTHAEPTFQVHNSIFYCVANMPGAVPVAATYALTNATLTYALAIANKGWERAASEDPALERGLNVHAGKVRYEAIALAHGYAV